MSLRKIIWIVVLLLVAGLLVFALRPTPLQVDVATVERRAFAVTVEEQGRTRARNPFTVAAPITGRLLRTTLDEGDSVRIPPLRMA